jgi:DNA-binding MarR family transcriptional regulator
MTESLDKAVDALTRLARGLERAAAPLSIADYRVLSAVAGGENRASRLAARLAVGKPAVSATVDSLARRGLITRERSADDQRALALALTAEGRAAFDRARTAMAERLRQVAAATGDPAESIRVLAGLDDAIDAARAAAAGVRA